MASPLPLCIASSSRASFEFSERTHSRENGFFINILFNNMLAAGACAVSRSCLRSAFNSSSAPVPLGKCVSFRHCSSRTAIHKNICVKLFQVQKYILRSIVLTTFPKILRRYQSTQRNIVA